MLFGNKELKKHFFFFYQSKGQIFTFLAEISIMTEV